MVNCMTKIGNGVRCQSECSNPRKTSVSENWFEVYEIASNLCFLPRVLGCSTDQILTNDSEGPR